VPQSPDNLSEASRPTRGHYSINGRKLTAPLAAFTMAGLLFFYSRTSIQAARLNAQKHREADGGQISWRNESLRRHGAMDKIDDRTLIKDAFMGDKKIVSSKEAAREQPIRTTGLSDSDQARALENYKRKQKRGFSSDES